MQLETAVAVLMGAIIGRAIWRDFIMALGLCSNCHIRTEFQDGLCQVCLDKLEARKNSWWWKLIHYLSN